MTNTTNLNLNIIEAHDLLDYAPFNENANLIDTAIGALQETAEAIPTLQTAVNQLETDTGENTTDISGLKTRMNTAEGNISDIQTVNTQQGLKITELENKSAPLILNGVETEITGRYNIINTNVEIKQNSYYGYYYAEVIIPKSSVGNPTNYKIVNACAYNYGVTFSPQTTGATIGAVSTVDNNIRVVFLLDGGGIAPNGLCCSVDLITHS